MYKCSLKSMIEDKGEFYIKTNKTSHFTLIISSASRKWLPAVYHMHLWTDDVIIFAVTSADQNASGASTLPGSSSVFQGSRKFGRSPPCFCDLQITYISEMQTFAFGNFLHFCITMYSYIPRICKQNYYTWTNLQ